MSLNVTEFSQFAINAHSSTNHMYDRYLPYEFHLRMVVGVGEKFMHLIPLHLRDIFRCILWGHDLIEDARISYADILKAVETCGGNRTDAVMIAEGIRALTNYGRGRNRDERMPDFVYEDIRTVALAEPAKLCDRCANVQYSQMTASSMFKKYKKENPHFSFNIRTGDTYDEMYFYLDKLFIES